MTDPRRQLPSVDQLLQLPGIADMLAHQPRHAVVGAVRQAIDAARRNRQGPPSDWIADVTERLVGGQAASLRPVLNATGVVLHTNLGRAPLAPVAIAAIQSVAGGYSTLEYDLATGTRGDRADHCRALLAELTGAEDGLVVNNAAGALLLALSVLAPGGRVLISRGELIEIGGSFRIPEILVRSGASLVEVGTTNRTHLQDYQRALPGAAAVLTVHRSNFEQRGFVSTPDPVELAGLAGHAGIPYLFDIGSGLLLDLSPWGLTGEPRVAEAVEQGADLVIFSGDKLLGGPQAGCLVGTNAAIRACRENPMARALRADKFTLAALEATLRLYQEPETATQSVPVLAMLTVSAEEVRSRATRLAALCPPEFAPVLLPGQSAVGGGSFPGAVLRTTLVGLEPGELGANGLALRLRLGDPPIVARVEQDRVVLDPRTLAEDSLEEVARGLRAAL